jgi:hypothetical protein
MIEPAFKKEWVAALRSGKYPQGTGALRSKDDHYCCLGVAAALRPDLAEPKLFASENAYAYFDPSDAKGCGDSGFPPPSLYDAVLGHEYNPMVQVRKLTEATRLALEDASGIDFSTIDGDEEVSLSDLNDANVPFELIALAIDEAL